VSKIAATRARLEGRKFKTTMRARFEGKAQTEAGSAVGDGLVSVAGQLYASDVGAGAGVVAVVNSGRPAAAQYTVGGSAGSAVIVGGGGGGGGSTTIITGGGGVTDHGLLQGLADDDHPQYLTTARGDARYLMAGAFDGDGLYYQDELLHVGAGNGIAVSADAVAVSLAANPGLVVGAGGLALGAPTANLSASSTNAVSGAAHTHAVTASDSPGAAAALLKSTSAGGLTLVTMDAGTVTATTKVRSPLIDTASGNLTIQPAGDVVLDPAGNDVLPQTNYDLNLGALAKKFLTLHAAELWVETLVAQNTIATIGGRILVGPTTTLAADLGDAAGDTTITVKHNSLNSGDRVYMEADGKLEWMAITSSAGGGAGAYTYSVTRNLDGTGRNAWYAGDAVFNTGQTGNGWIDLYSLYGVPRSGQTSTQRAGPTIAGNVRLSSTYNDFRERWAVGNLNGLYDYGTNVYGFAAGDPAATWLGLDATNGLRMMSSTTKRLEITAAGVLNINNSTGTTVIQMDGSGNSYFAGVMTIGTSGEIRQGSGAATFTPGAGNFTGLRLWNDTSVGRIGGYNLGALQWYGSTDGRLYGGAGSVFLDARGLGILLGSVADADDASVSWRSGSVTGAVAARIIGRSTAGSTYLELKSGNTYLQLNGTANEVNVNNTLSVQSTIIAATVPLRVTSEGNALQVAGTTHAYIEFYPDDVGVGRKGYLGYPSGSSDEMTLGNQYGYGRVALFAADNAGTPNVRRAYDVGLTSSTTIRARLGGDRWADGDSYLDILGDTSQSYYLRLLRRSDVAGNAEVTYEGSGELLMNANTSGAKLGLYVTATRRLYMEAAISLPYSVDYELPTKGVGLVIFANEDTGGYGIYAVQPGNSAGTPIVAIAEDGFDWDANTTNTIRFYRSVASPATFNLKNNFTSGTHRIHVTWIGKI